MAKKKKYEKKNPVGQKKTAGGCLKNFLMFMVIGTVVNVAVDYLADGKLDGFVSQEKRLAKAVVEPDDAITIGVGGVSYTLIHLPAGEFDMGATHNVPYEHEWLREKALPVRHVHLSEYWIGQTEVTRELWNAVMPDSMHYSGNLYYPATAVTWDDCQLFASRLNMMLETGEREYRLPTAAEWEYAARGGHRSKGYCFSGSNKVEEVAHYYDNSRIANRHVLTNVGSYAPNELGIFDMTGNVEEWCLDGSYWYNVNDTIDPYRIPVHETPYRPFPCHDYAVRGGGYLTDDDFLYVSSDYCVKEATDEVGFRIVLATPQEQLEQKEYERIVLAQREEERKHFNRDAMCPLGERPCDDIIDRYNSYPEAADYIGMGGTVVVEYDISEEGNIENVHTISFKVDDKCTYSEATEEQRREAIRSMKAMAENAIRHLPRHYPAVRDGVKVRCTRTWQFRYRFADPDDSPALGHVTVAMRRMWRRIKGLF